jgi:hypothetical protein
MFRGTLSRRGTLCMDVGTSTSVVGGRAAPNVIIIDLMVSIAVVRLGVLGVFG